MKQLLLLPLSISRQVRTPQRTLGLHALKSHSELTVSLTLAHIHNKRIYETKYGYLTN